MTRGCAICQRAPAKKAVCCSQKLCEEHTMDHPCPRAAELLAMTPQDVKRWKEENAPEEALATQVLAELNKLPGVTMWRTKRRQGARRSDDLDGVLDLGGHAAPDGIAVYVELKRDHKDDCGCRSCASQRDFAARAQGAGCVVVLGVRSLRQAVDGVKMGLARARAREAGVQPDPADVHPPANETPGQKSARMRRLNRIIDDEIMAVPLAALINSGASTEAARKKLGIGAVRAQRVRNVAVRMGLLRSRQRGRTP